MIVSFLQVLSSLHTRHEEEMRPVLWFLHFNQSLYFTQRDVVINQHRLPKIIVIFFYADYALSCLNQEIISLEIFSLTVYFMNKVSLT